MSDHTTQINELLYNAHKKRVAKYGIKPYLPPDGTEMVMGDSFYINKDLKFITIARFLFEKSPNRCFCQDKEGDIYGLLDPSDQHTQFIWKHKPKYNKAQPITDVIRSIITSKNDLHWITGRYDKWIPCIWLLQKLKEHDIKVSVDELKVCMLEIGYENNYYEFNSQLKGQYKGDPKLNVTISFMYFYPANTQKPSINRGSLFDRLNKIHLSLNEQESTIW